MRRAADNLRLAVTPGWTMSIDDSAMGITRRALLGATFGATFVSRLGAAGPLVEGTPLGVPGVAWELDGLDVARVREVFNKHQLLVGGTESHAGFCGIPEDRPRSLFIANAGVFTAPDDVDRLADAITEAGA